MLIVNRFIFPYTITAIFLLTVFSESFRAQMRRWTEQMVDWFNGLHPRADANFLLEHEFLNGFRLQLDTRWISLSIISTLGLIAVFEVMGPVPLVSSGEELWFAAMASGFLNPVSEELLLRAILLNLGVLTLYEFELSQYLTRVGEAGLILLAALIFTMGHTNPSAYHYLIRIGSSALFSVIYLGAGRNLLAPIVAHGTWNWYLIGKDIIELMV